jgi:hypothetical protein
VEIYAFPLKLRFQLRSLRDRILNAGYDDSDIDFIGMHNVPTSNVDKVLTDDGASSDASLEHALTSFHSLETYQEKG